MKMTQKVHIIAEIGSNYDSDLELAKKYLASSAANGADAVKFQTLKKVKLIAPRVRTAGGWEEHPAWQNFNNLELPEPWHFILKDYADEMRIEFLSTPFYLEAVDLLEKLEVNKYKIASGDITFLPLLEMVGRTGKPVLLSTGGSTNTEVEIAIKCLEKSGSGPITLLHCVVSYPPAFEEVNLKAMVTLKDTFGLNVGISDHSPGSVVALGAVALGATVIEKHVTFDRKLDGPDHPFAMTMTEFSQMINDVRVMEKALGDGKKEPSTDEKLRRHRFRRGVYDPVNFEPVTGSRGIWLRPEHKNLF